MADYAIVIKACSKIVCRALSRIKTQTMLWLYFIYCLFMPIFYVRQALLDNLLSIYAQFFSVRTIMQCKFHSKPRKQRIYRYF